MAGGNLEGAHHRASPALSVGGPAADSGNIRHGAAAARARVLVVEGEASMRAALSAALEAGGYEVRGEAHGAAIGPVAREWLPDLAILDVRLSAGPDGYAVARRLRRGGDLPVVFLSAPGGLAVEKAAYAAGADDYLERPFSMEQLLWRVGAVLRRCGRASSPVRVVGDLTVDEDVGQAQRAGVFLKLTPTEFRLLSVLVRRAGQVVSKPELLAEVWDYDAYAVNLVEVHMRLMRQKLEAHGPRLIHTVRGEGYVVRA